MKLKTRRRFSLMGNDYSAQEVRVFAASSRDSKMIKTYEEGKDLYSDVASMVYGLPYEECREFRPDGTFNLEGKQRRNKCKSLILGLLYGRGVNSIAEQIKSHKGEVTKADIEEAKKLSRDFFNAYPEGKAWIDKTHEDARKYGYVEDLWGRRRRLPDINLSKYNISSASDETTFNPLIGAVERRPELDSLLVEKYSQMMERARSKESRDEVSKMALKDGINIKSNSGFIAQAERQSVNSRIQGGSATITKLAMRNMYNDPELRDLDFHLLIPVHDEIIAEAPMYYAEEANKRMGYVMSHAAEPECVIAMKTDGDVFSRWYADVAYAHLKEDYEAFLSSGMDAENAFNKTCEKNEEFDPDEIREVLSLQ